MKELVAVTNTLRALLSHVKGHVIRLWEDNQAVIWILTNGCSRSPEIMNELRQLWWLLAKHNIQLVPEYIPSALNPADYWSRVHDRDDWSLAPQWFRLAEQRWGTHTIDRFATCLNRQVTRYNSHPRWHDADSEARDAFTQIWTHENNWINPPWDLISSVIAKLRRERASATLVVPVWTTAPWWPDLIALASDSIMIRDPTKFTFAPGHGGPIAPLRNPNWQVGIFRIQF